MKQYIGLNGEVAIAKIYTTKEVKYETNEEGVFNEYQDMVAFETYDCNNQEMVDAIEATLEENQKDELHEYLRIFFKDGSIMLFRNSHVSLFVIPQGR